MASPLPRTPPPQTSTSSFASDPFASTSASTPPFVSAFASAYTSASVSSVFSAHLLSQRLPGGQHATAIRLTGDTPLRRNSASVRSLDYETHASVDAHLAQELHDQVCYDVPEYLSRLLMPSDPARRSAVAAIADACVATMSAPLLTSDGWKSCRDYDERCFQPAFARLWHSIIDLAAALPSPPGSSSPPLPLPDRCYLPNATRFLARSKTCRKLDFFVAARGPGDPLDWSRVLFLAEMKNRVKDPTPANIALQLGGYAREVFYAQPHRRFVHALYLFKSEVTLFRFDRSGALASPRFDMHKDWETFARTVLAYAYMDPLDMGFDPSFTLASPALKLPPPASERNENRKNGGDDGGAAPVEITTDITIPSAPAAEASPSDDHQLPPMPPAGPLPANTYTLAIGPEVYLLKGVLDSRKVVSGRATTCWEAKLLSGEDNFVVKDSWRQIDQRGEGYIYQLAKEAAVEGLLDMASDVVAPDPRNAACDDTVLESVRRGCAGPTTPQRRKRRPAGPAGEEPSAKRHSVKKSMSKNKKQAFAAAEQSSRTHDDTHDDAASTATSIVDRVRVRIVFRNPVGIPLSQVSSARAFFTIIRDALQCHRDLYTKAGILHRDISVYNILATTPQMVLTGGVARAGLLFDFDYAISVKTLSSGATHRTGTLPFLAVRVLKGRYNTYRADLESFFYVMCYGCVVFNGRPPPRPPRKPKKSKKRDRLDDQGAQKPLAEWENGTAHTIASLKIGTLESPVSFREHILKHFTPMFSGRPGVIRLMRQLRKYVVRSPWFHMNTLEEEIEEREEKMMLEQSAWEEKVKAEAEKRMGSDGVQVKLEEAEESPAARLRREIMAEEDEDAHELYANMMHEIEEALAQDDL